MASESEQDKATRLRPQIQVCELFAQYHQLVCLTFQAKKNFDRTDFTDFIIWDKIDIEETKKWRINWGNKEKLLSNSDIQKIEGKRAQIVQNTLNNIEWICQNERMIHYFGEKKMIEWDKTFEFLFKIIIRIHIIFLSFCFV